MVTRIILAVYVVILAVIGFFPTPVDRPEYATLTLFVAWCARNGLLFVTYARIEFTANIFLFLPFGVLLTLIFRLRRWWIGPVFCFVCSVLIETGQGLLLPERVASVEDVISNTLGGFIGTAISVAILIVRRAGVIRRRSAADASAPSVLPIDS